MLNEPRPPLNGDSSGPSGWGSPQWQMFALAHGGVRMLITGGKHSAQRKRYRTRSMLRRLRDQLVGLGWLEKVLRGR